MLRYSFTHRSSGRNRAAFTLVELLVVIAIIGILAGLLTVGLMAAREASRRATCINNQKQIATAILAYANTTDGELPPLVGTKLNYEMSWLVAILPHMGQKPVYDSYLKGTYTPTADNRIPGLYCPSDTERPTATLPGTTNINYTDLGYVVNCGEYYYFNSNTALPNPLSGAVDEKFECGLFYDMRTKAYPAATLGHSPYRVVTLDSIKKGASNVIMMAENLQGTNWLRNVVNTDVADQFWYDEENDPATSNPSKRMSTECGAVKDIGFIWGDYSAAGARVRFLNQGNQDQNASGTIGHARPSSNHPGIVIVTYADGHVDVLNDDMTKDVYRQMCDPQTGNESTSHTHP